MRTVTAIIALASPCASAIRSRAAPFQGHNAGYGISRDNPRRWNDEILQVNHSRPSPIRLRARHALQGERIRKGEIAVRGVILAACRT